MNEYTLDLDEIEDAIVDSDSNQEATILKAED